MIQINQTYTIHAPLKRVWHALTSADGAAQWGAAPARFEAHEGGYFSYWGGDIHGTNIKIVPYALLRQEWYGDTNPDRKYDVSFTFKGDDTITTVQVTHQAWDDDSHTMGDGWRDYYFEPIKKALETQ